MTAKKFNKKWEIFNNFNVDVFNGNNAQKKTHVYLGVIELTYPNYAAMDPWSDEQQAEFEKKFRKVISEQDQDLSNSSI